MNKKKIVAILLSALIVSLVLLVAAKAIWINAFAINGDKLLANQERDDLLERRNYLLSVVRDKEAIFRSVPQGMSPHYQGEWALVTCSMTVAALANMSFIYTDTKADNLQYMQSLITECLTERYREFDRARWSSDALKSLQTTQGHVGYLGHVNFMISAYKLAGGGDEFDKQFVEISCALIEKYKASENTNNTKGLLETYPGEVYIPDNVVAIASLENLVRFALSKSGTEAIRKIAPPARWAARDWIAKAKTNDWRDSRNGLLVFRVIESGGAATQSRGSGCGWNSFYLPYIDEELAREQYEKLKSHLFTKVWGLFPGIREYPDGVAGKGDVDSGPVIMGLSASGTGFAIAGARFSKDVSSLNDLLFTSELVGCTVRDQLSRHYLTAPLVGEAIMLAMKSHTVWEPYDKEQSSRPISAVPCARPN